MNSRLTLFLILWTGMAHIGAAQIKELPIFRRFTLSADDGSKWVFYAEPFDFRPNSDKTYTWYAGNRIQHTRGGYSGKLLNGTYTAFFPNKSLREQGRYVKGMKQGVWRSWYDNGNLQRESQWLANIEEGPFVLYDEQGNWTQRGHLKEGQPHGRIENRADSTLTYSYYEQGTPISKEAYENSNLFRKTGKLIGDRINRWFGKKENQPLPAEQP